MGPVDPINNIVQQGEGTETRDWHPIHILQEWNEGPGTPNMVSIVLTWPSGVNNNTTEINIRAANCCRKLELTVSWLKEIITTSEIHRWKKFASYHPRLIEFEEALSKKREKRTDSITSTACIELPMKVMKNFFEFKRLGFRDKNILIIYIDLEADNCSDYIDKSNDTIEML